MKSLELIEVDDELGVILPEEVIAKLQVGLGDAIKLTETADGFCLQSTFSADPIYFHRSTVSPKAAPRTIDT